MEETSSNFHQFKITLEGVKPAIWRRIQVPETYSFWDLHVAIQDAMGWQYYHLHEFEITHPKTGDSAPIGIPDDDFEWSRATQPGWVVAIADYFTKDNRIAIYKYDFGDDWQHRIRLEAIEETEPDMEFLNNMTVIHDYHIVGLIAGPLVIALGLVGYSKRYFWQK